MHLRCPACQHTFSISPSSRQQAPPTDYDEESIGAFPKALLGTLAAMGIALIAFLTYKILQGPDSPEPASPVAIHARDDKPKPPPGATKPAAKTPPKKAPAPAPAALSPENLFAKASPAVVRIVVRDRRFRVTSFGSGFFVSADGLLVTNYHVLGEGEFATVLLTDNSTLFVDGVAASMPDADLALLKVNGKNLPHLSIASDAMPKVGAKVFAIGNPKGLTNTFSQGMVSGHRQWEADSTLIQTTAAISRGSSGGPLLAVDGSVVGVTTLYLLGGQNLNFAVPAAVVRRLIRNQGKLRTLAGGDGKWLGGPAAEQLHRAWAAMDRRDWQTAAKILTSLRKTQKGNPFVWFALGYLHGQIGNHKSATEMYKQAVAVNPAYADAYVNLGTEYRHMGRYGEAVSAYKKAIAIKPDLADAHLKMGIAYGYLKRYTQAVAAFKKTIAIEPDSVNAYYNMGLAYGYLNRYAEAAAAFKRAIAIVPDFIEAYLNLGTVYGHLKRHTDAIAAFKKAIAIYPDCADAYHNMAVSYHFLRRYADAIAAYETALRLEPDAAWADSARKALADLQRKRSRR